MFWYWKLKLLLLILSQNYDSNISRQLLNSFKTLTIQSIIWSSVPLMVFRVNIVRMTYLRQWKLVIVWYLISWKIWRLQWYRNIKISARKFKYKKTKRYLFLDGYILVDVEKPRINEIKIKLETSPRIFKKY